MSREYDKYLMEHRAGVADAWRWMLDNIREDLDDNSIFVVPYSITCHDASKYSLNEYDAYDAYFYGNRTKDVEERFNQAWLHHVHENPHHWQHWILMEDDPETGESFKCLEMPEAYVLEMICDWWSFSWKTGNLYEIFDWYEKHEDTIKLHPETRILVEEWLGKIKFFLDQEKEEEE